nr:hypothetical protein [uncultured Dethiosulfovibrio sp.]
MNGIYVVMLETSGNQSYIFSTNKMRDVVGASELIYRVGTTYVERAVWEIFGRQFSAKAILDEPKIEENESCLVEVVVSTSGKALLLIRDDANCNKIKSFIRTWSRLVVTEAPGVDALGVYSEVPVDLSKPLDRDEKGSLLCALKEGNKNLRIQKIRRSSPLERFQRIPVVSPCVYSGLPAEDIGYEGETRQVPLSKVSRAKIEAGTSDEFKKRMKSLYPENKQGIVAKGLKSDALEDSSWLGVVHADGNGLGQLFTNFHEYVQGAVKESGKAFATGRDYVDFYRAFSRNLDDICAASFWETVDAVFPDSNGKGREIPVVPIVVGGDDLTLVLDGRYAIEFTKKFLELFSKKTEEKELSQVIPIICKVAGMSRLGICGGITVAKGHFPFSESYRLAEELLNSAKKVKNAVGSEGVAMDFHILYDSVVTSLKDIRGGLVRDRKEGDSGSLRELTGKPYAIFSGSEKFNKKYEHWSEIHNFKIFKFALKALQDRDDKGRLQLPSSQSHAIREALFSERRETQEQEWRVLCHTYDSFRKSWIKANPEGKLYSSYKRENEKLVDTYETCYVTPFLDALEATEFYSDMLEKEEDQA